VNVNTGDEVGTFLKFVTDIGVVEFGGEFKNGWIRPKTCECPRFSREEMFMEFGYDFFGILR